MIGCPLPRRSDHVQLAHGGGGRLMTELIDKVFAPAFGTARERNDSTVFELGDGKLALTTDSFVVTPYFFPGGDIGSLAVHGTLNDLAMSGAKPVCLTAAFVLEEGLPLADLACVVQSMGRAAKACGVSIVAGDTKVVDRGKGDGIFITTTGLGIVQDGIDLRPTRVRAGDRILVSGDLGRHGIAILTTREGLKLESEIETDSAPLDGLVRSLLEAGVELHCLRDCTRGGLAAALNEIARDAELTVEIVEKSIPVRPDVRGACELLGLDPLYVANEGAFVAFVAEKDAERALKRLREIAPERMAALCGVVREKAGFPVILENVLGTRRVLDMPSGEQLPRIC